MVRTEPAHERVGKMEASTDEGSLTLIEYKCDVSGKYVLVETTPGIEWCPQCGGQL